MNLVQLHVLSELLYFGFFLSNISALFHQKLFSENKRKKPFPHFFLIIRKKEEKNKN